MSKLSELVKIGMKQNTGFATLPIVVEKEILHHDVVSLMSEAGVLSSMVFIGGTSLRMCHNAKRLSEDLDFSLNKGASSSLFDGLKEKIESGLKAKYDLSVELKEPKQINSDTSTWKIIIETQANRPDIPKQRINIDVCSIPSLHHELKPLINHYGLPVPTSSLLVPVQTMQETLADKFVALAFRNNIKARDLWDIVWLDQQGIKVNHKDVIQKLDMRNKSPELFEQNIFNRILRISTQADIKEMFNQEMKRFIPMDSQDRTVNNKDFWPYLSNTIKDNSKALVDKINNGPALPPRFEM